MNQSQRFINLKIQQCTNQSEIRLVLACQAVSSSGAHNSVNFSTDLDKFGINLLSSEIFHSSSTSYNLVIYLVSSLSYSFLNLLTFWGDTRYVSSFKNNFVF